MIIFLLHQGRQSEEVRKSLQENNFLEGFFLYFRFAKKNLPVNFKIIMIIEENGFIDHVFFWLKNPESKEEHNELIAGLQKLSNAATIQSFNIGKPADTSRSVIDSTYSMSWLLLFKTKKDHDDYQTDPVHLKFVEECAHLWNKIVVYDTVSV